MKKIFTLAVALTAVLSASATDYNFFPAADGWLFLNSQNVINKYVGIIDETNYKADATNSAKIVQMVYANQYPDYPATTADPTIVGAGTDGTIGSAGSTTGAIILQPTSGSMKQDGGGFILAIPSCSTLSIDYSSQSKVMARILATTNPDADMNNTASTNDLNAATGWKVISAAYASVFKRLPAGRNTWTGIEELSNGSDETTIKSATPIYVWFQSCTNDTVYIHSIKVTTPKQETTGISNIAFSGNNAKTEVFTIDGKYIGHQENLNKLERGLYIIKKGNKSEKYLVD